MPKKRIFYVITKATWGGAQRYVYELARAAHTQNNDVTLVYGDEGELAHLLTSLGIRTIRIPELTRDVSASDQAAYKALRDLFAKEKPEVVHLNSSKAGGLGALAARHAGVPRIIFTAHGWAFNEARPWWQRWPIRILSRRIVRLSHLTICVSDAVRRDIQTAGIRAKLVVVKNGIEPELQLPREEARKALAPQITAPYWIGMLSELHPTKRIEDAILAMKNVPDAHLFVLGEGELRKTLESLITKNNLSDRVHLLGFVANAPRYLRAFDLFLHTSRSEALSLAILEAGAAGLPIVATRVGGIPEVIEDGVSGLLVPSYSPAKVATAISDLQNNPQRAFALGEAAKEKVLREFSLEHMIQKTLALY